MTSGAASGDQPQPRPRSANETRADNVIELFPALLEDGETFVHPLELGSKFLFFGLLALMFAIVGGMVVGYAALAPKPIEYRSGMEADGFKGH
jgi:hypothetical protein